MKKRRKKYCAETSSGQIKYYLVLYKEVDRTWKKFLIVKENFMKAQKNFLIYPELFFPS